MAVNNTGDHKGSRQDNFWKRKEAMASQIENFKAQNPSLYAGQFSLPSYEGPAEESDVSGVEKSDATNSNFLDSYSQEQSTQPNIDNVLNLKTVSAGDAPVYNVEQQKALQKQLKIAALAQGLQGVFGSIASARGNDFAYANDTLGGQAISRLNQLDKTYFDQLAQHRDQALKAQLYNAGVENDAELAQFRARQQQLTDDRRIDQQNLDREDRQAFDAEQAKLDRELRKRGYSIDQERINNYNSAQKLEAIKRYEAEYDDLSGEYKSALENFDEARANEIRTQMQANVSTRRDLQKQLAEREGFTFEEQKSTKTPSQSSQASSGGSGAAMGAAFVQQALNGGEIPSTQPKSTTKPKVSPERTQAVGELMSAFKNDPNKVIPQEQRKVLIQAVMDLGYSEEQAAIIVQKKAEDFGKTFGQEQKQPTRYRW